MIRLRFIVIGTAIKYHRNFIEDDETILTQIDFFRHDLV
jgi:hypothetical protein